MAVWKEKATEIADLFPTVLRLPDERPGDVPRITQPLDQGATALLGAFSPDITKLEYSPFYVERLMDDITNHIGTCTRIRDQAQQLEVQAFREMMEIETRQRINKLIEAHLATAKTYEPKQISNQTELTVSGASVSGKGQAVDPYWTTMADWQDGQLNASKDEIEQRLAKYIEPGNGNNYVGRFAFLKQLFDNELVILYKKILAASVGLREIYGLAKPEIPALRDVGYLDLLVFWAQGATNALQKSLLRLDVLTLTIPFHDANAATEPQAGLALMPHDKFLTARQAGQIPFNITEGTLALPGVGPVKNPRLRGFDLWFVDNRNAFTPLPPWASVTSFRGSITLPNPSPQMDFIGRPASIAVPFLQINHLSLVSSAPDIRMYRNCYNTNPVGSWTLRLEKGLKAEDPKTATEETLFMLFLRLQFVYQTAG
jgi:hypothetical protein